MNYVYKDLREEVSLVHHSIALIVNIVLLFLFLKKKIYGWQRHVITLNMKPLFPAEAR